MKIDSPKHRKWVAEQPCIVTGYQGEYGVPHHLLRTGEHGMGKKSSDIWCVPLHSTIHDALHKNGNEIAFFANHGLDYEYVKSMALYYAKNSPCLKVRRAVNG